MELKTIYTDRVFQRWPSWHIVFEWEDVFRENLKLPLTDTQEAVILTKYVDKAARFLSRKICGNSYKLLSFADKYIYRQKALYFEVYPRGPFYFTGSKNTLPIIIDFWKDKDLDQFYHTYENCSAILISSIEVYNYLVENRFPKKLYHFPLSLSDKYRLTSASKFTKVYDIVIPGRNNPVLWGYLLEYEKKFPEVEYLYQKQINGEFYYISNKSGVVGKFSGRDEYINLLRSAKVGLYSTPGIDGDEKRTGGFCPVTPRFFELLSAGCNVIARYPKNAETIFFELDKVCTLCTDYLHFENALTFALEEKHTDFEKIQAYLAKHYTSERITLLKQILSQIH